MKHLVRILKGFVMLGVITLAVTLTVLPFYVGIRTDNHLWISYAPHVILLAWFLGEG